MPILTKAYHRILDKPDFIGRIERATKVGDVVRLEGWVSATYDVSSYQIVIRKFREEEFTHYFPLNMMSLQDTGLKLLTEMRLPKMLVKSYFQCDLQLDWATLVPAIYSVTLLVDGYEHRRVFWPDYVDTVSMDEVCRTLHFCRDPVVDTGRMEVLAITSRDIDALKVKAQEPKSRTERPLCMIAEYTNSARDNGIALFKRLREQDFGVQPFFSVEEENGDGVVPDGKSILAYGTFQHLARCLECDVVAFTHHRTYGYPTLLQTIAPKRYAATKTLFLQHGVTALKREVLKNYHYDVSSYDAVCVCSELEQGFFLEHFGYTQSQIKITGFPRHDLLVEPKNLPAGRERVLIFPTWRRGLDKISTGEAAESEFVQQWISAITSLKNELSEDGKTFVTLILHPIIQRHKALFEPHVDEVRDASDFQDVLSMSQVLITDYSSVCFDAVYLGKPVLLFQFDAAEYFLAKDAFIDIKTQQPGVVCGSIRELLSAARELKSKHWKSPQTEISRSMYFANIDSRNCERVAAVIRSLALDT